jgi:Kef-type K+ transport system membrane component KefB
MHHTILTWLVTDNFSKFAAHLLKQIQQPICLLLLQMLIILSISRLFGLLFARFNQPTVIGEIMAGIFLGVSFFGNLFPDVFNFIFPLHSVNYLEVISKIGLCLFMFVIGMELDVDAFKRKAKTVIFISLVSIIFPFLLSTGSAFLVYPMFAMPHSNFLSFSLFFGLTFSITAFPVLARIIKSRNMQKTELGIMSLSIAAIIDVIVWCLLALIIPIAKADNMYLAMFTIISAIVFILFMFFIVRPFLNSLIFKLRTAHYGDSNIIILAFIILLLSSFLAEFVGIHMLFGAFLAGVIIPNSNTLRHALSAKVEDVSTHLFLPIFFTLTGLRLQISFLNTTYLWIICLIIILMALITKFLGTALPARMSGMSWANSLSLSALMNTRGLMEIVVLNIGYELGILSPSLFAILVLMAIVTTVMTCPLLDLIDYVYRAPSKKIK